MFLEAVTETAAADYSREQIAAWARPEQRTLADWNHAMHGRSCHVALISRQVAGFSDVSADGYIQMMFVSPRCSRQGVASALLDRVEDHARGLNAQSLSANVSITARPFFERHGFAVVAEQQAVVEGVRMTNFRMVKAHQFR